MNNDNNNNIYERLYGKTNDSNEGKHKDVEMDIYQEDSGNLSLGVIITLASIIISIAGLFALVISFSYDLCIIMDKYYMYCAIVCGILLLYSIYISVMKIRKMFSILAILNIILSLCAMVFFVIPFVTGLIYF